MLSGLNLRGCGSPANVCTARRRNRRKLESVVVAGLGAVKPRPSVKVDQDCDGVSVGVRVGRHDPEHCQLVRNDAVGVK